MFPNLAIELTANGITRREFAKYIGCSEKALGDKLAGKFDFKFTEMKKSCELFGKSMDYLFSETRAEVSAS